MMNQSQMSRFQAFSIDGNCENLPFVIITENDIHDAERQYILGGYTNHYCQNITVQKHESIRLLFMMEFIHFGNNVNVIIFK